MSIAFILLTAPFVHHSTPTHVPSWAGNAWYAVEVCHIADKTQNLFKLCNIGWIWHMCDGFNFVTVRSHAVCTYNVANALYFFFCQNDTWLCSVLIQCPISMSSSAQHQDSCLALSLLLHKLFSTIITNLRVILTTTPSWRRRDVVSEVGSHSAFSTVFTG